MNQALGKRLMAAMMMTNDDDNLLMMNNLLICLGFNKNASYIRLQR